MTHESSFGEAVEAAPIDGASKIAWFMRTFGPSIWFGLSVGDVHKTECDRGKPIAPREIIHAEYSAKLQALASFNSQAQLARRLRGTFDKDAQRQLGEAWAGDAREFGIALAENYAKASSPFARSDRQLDSFIADPRLGTMFAKYTGANADRLGNAFLERPTDFAFGRFMAIWTWHAARSFLAGSRPTTNDWHDSHYLFLATYTKMLITDESRGALARAASGLFPSVQVMPGATLFSVNAA